MFGIQNVLSRNHGSISFVGSLAVLITVGGCTTAIVRDGGADDGGRSDAGTRVDASVEPDAGTDSGVSSATLPEFLAAVDGLTVAERDAAPESYRVFDLRLDVPLDPADSSSPVFAIRGVLHARQSAPSDAPMVLLTNGYTMFYGEDSLYELTELLSANQLSLEYRYFGASAPTGDPEFEHLTTEAGAHDVHRFVQALQPFFHSPWISTGRSRGGEVALHHRALYPEEVIGTVAYVTPDVDAAPDERYLTALRELGTTECRAALDGLQRRMLSTHRVTDARAPS